MNRAVLSMYEWPETAGAVAELWQAIRTELLTLDLTVPTALDHPTDLYAAWRSPDLLVGQTCGLPLVRTLREDVCVLGTFDHHLPNTAPGDYHSVLIVNRSNAATGLADLAGAPVAVNGLDSQSGYAALVHHVAPLATHGQFFGEVEISGGHRESVRAIARGSAQLAAIDAVSWQLALEHEPASLECRVLQRTDPTPALPLITSAANAAQAEGLTRAISKATTKLPEAAANTLHIYGFVRHHVDDYTILTERLSTARTLGYEDLN